jgi:quinohemoprotein ethanol dehydrogenase
MTVAAVDDPSLQIDPADAAAGALVFNAKCSACHGLDAVSASGPAPDLRESRLALSRDDVWNVLHAGALLQAGMPRYDELSEAQVRQIYAFIRARARAALSVRKPEL